MSLIFLLFSFLVDQPIILKAEELPLLNEKKIEEIAVYVYKEGKRELIPFQIDEIDKEGSYLTRYVKKDGKFYERKEGWKFKRFNGKDELVFMEEECGEKEPARDIRNFYEIKIEKDGKECYFYISEETIKIEKKGYISYNPSDDIFSSEFFSYGSLGISNPSILNYFLVKDHHKSLIEKFHLYLFISSWGGKIKFERTEEDISAEVIGYTDGPVRLIKLMSYRMKLAKGIQSPKVKRTSIAYRRCGMFPTEVNIPINPSLIVKDAILRLSFEFTDLIEKFTLLTQNGERVSLNSLQNSEKKKVSSINKITLSGEKEDIIVQFIMPEKIVDKIKEEIFLSKGEKIWLFWELKGFEKLGRGNYPFTFLFCIGKESEESQTIRSLTPLNH